MHESRRQTLLVLAITSALSLVVLRWLTHMRGEASGQTSNRDEDLPRAPSRDELVRRGSGHVSLVNNTGSCTGGQPLYTAGGEAFTSTGSHDMCVAVLTGYPDVARWEYLTRLLDNLRREVVAPAAYDLHVFCQGSCHEALCSVLNVSAIYHEITRTVHMQVPAARQTMRQMLHPDRWYYLSQNYQVMFEQLFVRRHTPYRHCLILEDDLLLAADALYYVEGGADLMRTDDSVFSISLNTINSVTGRASDTGQFRRVSHFSGLGFAIGRRSYVEHVRRKWVRNKPWDLVLQSIFDRNPRLAAIQPEVTRSVHESRKHVRTLSESRTIRNNTVIASAIRSRTDYKLHNLSLAEHDRSIKAMVKSVRNLTMFESISPYDYEQEYVYTNCKDEDDLDKILGELGLVGRAMGGAVRGIYKQTVFVRYYLARILIICRTSPFYKHLKIT